MPQSESGADEEAHPSVELVRRLHVVPHRQSLKQVALLPLDFPTYLAVQSAQSMEPAVIKELFEEYLETGGFPKSINRHPDAAEALLDSVVSETYRHGKSPQLLKDLAAAVVRRVPSPLSYHSLAQEIGVSHNTVREYLEFLSDIYMIGIAYAAAGYKPQPRREKKIFFRDPLIYRAFAHWTSKKINEAALLEHVMQEHLYRKFGEVYYHRNKTEIDAVAGPYKVEVKTTRPRRGYPRGVVTLTKEKIPRFLLELAGVTTT